MNKTLFGLALLTYNWETNKKDIVDSYIYLVCHILKQKNYDKALRDNIQADFIESYGINVPLGPIETIFTRMANNGLLSRRSGEFYVIYDKVHEVTKNSEKVELDKAFSSLVDDIKDYSSSQFDAKFEKEEIETGLIAFFKENDLDLLFASTTTKSVMPQLKESKKAKYIIAKYITELQERDANKFSVVLKLAKGYTIASLITYNDIQNFSGNLNNVEIFLDAPIIFNLLGLNGDSNLRLAQELIDALKKNDAKLRIFEVNHGEVVNTIQYAITALTSRNFNLTSSSRIVKTAVRENISPAQLQIKLNQLEGILSSYEISKVSNPPIENKYLISENRLTEIIESLYSKGHEHKISWYKANQIERDVSSISNIFKIRRNTRAINLKSSRAVLLTSNQVISYASRVYEKEHWDYKSNIPVCVTDIFLSTVLWANYPTRNENLNTKQLISECYSVIELDNRLLTRFYEDINRMHKEHIISDEQFYLLSASNITYSLLERKTLNDIDEYTDKTPREILDDIQEQLNQSVDEEKGKVSRIETNLRRYARIMSKAIFILIAGIIILLSVILKAINPKLDGKVFDIISWTLSVVFSIFGFLRWAEKIPTKTKIETYFEETIYKGLRNKLDKS